MSGIDKTALQRDWVILPQSIKNRRISSESLMGDRKQLQIVHAGEEYLLRITRKGKLILTK
jgi:hemin uptake protein HemP